MTLAVMVATDEDALVCDFAETYHIMDYKALPVRQRAVLASGLRDNSRIKMKMAGMTEIPVETVVPQIADSLNLLRYSLTKSASDGIPYPGELFTDIMQGKAKDQPLGFEDEADFWAERDRIIKGAQNG